MQSDETIYTPPEYDRWEYKLVVLTGSASAELEQQLNELGRDGWELVGSSGYYIYFKRPLD